MVWIALATACGAGAGVLADRASSAAWLLLAATALAALAWVAGWTAAGGPPELGTGEHARGRPSLGLLAALAAAAFARAAAPSVTGTPGMEGAELTGAWQPRDGVHGRELGTLGPAESRANDLFELGVGWAVEGELVRVLDTADRTRSARGLDAPTDEEREVWTPRADELVRLEPSSSARSPFARARARLLAACDRAGGAEHGPLLRALVCGDTSRFDAETLDLFTRTGTRHLLAVSGQHVTWIAAFALRPLAQLVGGALAWFLPGRFVLVREFLFLAAVLVYVPLAGGASPVRRAAVAFVLAVAAGALLWRARGGRRIDVLSLWSTALLAEVTLAPRSISEVALLLSYAATLGLLLGAGPLARSFTGPRRFELAERWHTTLARRGRRAVALALGASLAAVLATLPIAWSVFGEFSVPGALITVVAVPLFALLLLGAWLWVLLPGLDWATPCVAVAEWLRAWFEFGDRLPGTPLVLPPRPWSLVALAVVATFAALAWRNRPRRRARALASAAVIWAAVLWPWSAAPRGLEVVLFDVGHGTAVALRAPGSGAWLFDGGSRDRTRVAQAAIAPCLAGWESASIGVVASHDDSDHVSALPWLAERFRARIWAGALADGERARSHVETNVLDVDRGTLRLPTAGPLELAIVRGEDRPGNQGSRSLRATAGPRSVLLCGDSEGSALALQRASNAFLGPVDVLLAPHHGSDPEALGALLERTAPREVWISSSAPAAILAELARRRIPVRQTWCDGALALDAHATEAQKSTVPTDGGDSARAR